MSELKVPDEFLAKFSSDYSQYNDINLFTRGITIPEDSYYVVVDHPIIELLQLNSHLLPVPDVKSASVTLSSGKKVVRVSMKTVYHCGELIKAGLVKMREKSDVLSLPPSAFDEPATKKGSVANDTQGEKST